ncbi:Protein white [Armadillidium nasatum]|uniref:Protein white n=1 Tax=Armadillidium nasatum TaxID=96803 RepID=A0A5N5SPK9_9CRUS|nr:Protein white [Armadillidium nasatum]
MGKTCPLNYNPADFFISTLAIKPGEEEESLAFTRQICDTFEQSEDMRSIEEAVKNNMSSDNVQEDDLKKKRKRRSPYKATRFQQFKALLTRVFLELAREPMLVRIQIVQSIMVALIVGLIYLDTSGEYTATSVQNINGVLFIFLSNISFSGTFGVVNTFCEQIPIFLREHLSGMYRCDTFFITKNIAELPMAIFMPFLFTAICYFLVNLNRDVSAFFTIIGVMILCGNVGYSFGYLISCLAPNLAMALNIAAPLLIPFMLFGGYFLNPDTIPPYFIWLRYISWFNYGFEALAIAQWKDITYINCTIPLNCEPTGVQVITDLGYDPDNLGFDFALLVVLLVAYRFLAYLLLLRRAYVGL